MSSKLIGPGRKRGTNPQRLTEKQREFCEEYLANGMNGSQAARSAGYSKPSSASNQLLHDKKVKAYLEKRLTEIQEEIDISRVELLDIMRRVLKFNLMKYSRGGKGKSIVVDEEHYDKVAELIGDCVTKINVTEYEDDNGVGRTIEIELMSKMKMFEMAMKYKGMMADEGGVNVNIGGQVIDFDELATPPEDGDVIEGKIEGRE